VVWGEVAKWAVEHGDDPLLRIALCGYEGEHEIPENWECVPWKTGGGYGLMSDGRGRENINRERIWFSPHCLRPSSLF
jgi:DNA adenine methylase